LAAFTVSKSWAYIADEKIQDLIKDEINVENIIFVDDLEGSVKLDTNITPDLKEKGDLRELLRKIQDLRKEKGLKVGDKATLTVTDDLKSLADKYGDEIKKATSITNIEVGEGSELKLSP